MSIIIINGRGHVCPGCLTPMLVNCEVLPCNQAGDGYLLRGKRRGGGKKKKERGGRRERGNLNSR